MGRPGRPIVENALDYPRSNSSERIFHVSQIAGLASVTLIYHRQDAAGPSALLASTSGHRETAVH